MISPFFIPLFFTLVSGSPSSGTAPGAQFQATHDPIAISQIATDSGQPICYKMRTYVFERNDGDAPKLVRETTCGPARPHVNRSKAPKVRLVPAN